MILWKWPKKVGFQFSKENGRKKQVSQELTIWIGESITKRRVSGIEVAKIDGFGKCGDEGEEVSKERRIGRTIIAYHEYLVLVVSMQLEDWKDAREGSRWKQ